MPLSSEELLEQASAGDVDAIDVLLERHLPGLRAFVRLRTGKLIRAKESVSDIVQSVCREVIAHADRFQHGGDVGFRHWLYTTALRKLSKRRDFYEAAKRDAGREATPQSPLTSGSDGELLDCYATFCTPSRIAVAREELDLVEQAFDKLPDHYREVILLAKLVGLTRAEIAKEIGKSEIAVRSLLHRALAELTEHLDRGEGA